MADKKRPPTDAEALAMIRLLSMTVERLLIRLYFSDKSTYSHLVDHMRQCIRSLWQYGKKQMHSRDEEECPDSLEKCADGLCADICLEGFESD